MQSMSSFQVLLLSNGNSSQVKTISCKQFMLLPENVKSLTNDSQRWSVCRVNAKTFAFVRMCSLVRLFKKISQDSH